MSPLAAGHAAPLPRSPPPAGFAPRGPGVPRTSVRGKRGIAVVRSDSKPEHDAADGDDGDVIAQRLLVACGEAPGLLEHAVGALDRRPRLVPPLFPKRAPPPDPLSPHPRHRDAEHAGPPVP